MSVDMHLPPDMAALVYGYYNPHKEYFKKVLRQIRILALIWPVYIKDKHAVTYCTTRLIHTPTRCSRYDVWHYTSDPDVTVLPMNPVRFRLAYAECVSNCVLNCGTCVGIATFRQFCRERGSHYCESCNRHNQWYYPDDLALLVKNYLDPTKRCPMPSFPTYEDYQESGNIDVSVLLEPDYYHLM
jgi:hypothetical protein